ncbi:MAG: hypothetical protein NVSMB5_04750 [Candidatus Velthaea sp.]
MQRKSLLAPATLCVLGVLTACSNGGSINATPSVSGKPAYSNLYVADRGTNDVTVLMRDTGAKVATIAVGTAPAKLAEDGKRIYVVNSGSNSVSVIDTTSNTVIKTIPVGKSPLSITISRLLTSAYVANSADNTLTVIDLASLAVSATIPVGSNPTSLVTDQVRDEVVVANSGDSTVQFIDSNTNTIEQTLTLSSPPIAVTGNCLARYNVSLKNNSVVRLDNGSPLTAKAAPYRATDSYALAFTPGSLVSGTESFVADPAGNTIKDIGGCTFPADPTPKSIAVGKNPAGMAEIENNVYVADSGSDAVTVADRNSGLGQTYSLAAGSQPVDIAYLRFANASGGTTPPPAVSPSPAASASALPAPSPSPSALPTVAAGPQHLYVTGHDAQYHNRLLAYPLPLTQLSQPDAVVPFTGATGAVAADARGNVAAATYEGSAQKIYLYRAPLTNLSAPTITIAVPPSGAVSALAFDPAGDLLASSYYSNVILVWRAPLTSGMTPTDTISGFTDLQGVAVDVNGNAYAGDNVPTPGATDRPTGTVAIFAPPYTAGRSSTLKGASGASQFSAIAVGGGNVYAQNSTVNGDGKINVFTSPTAAAPAFAFGYAETLAVDAGGNLYAASSLNNYSRVTVYSAPVTPSSATFDLNSANGLGVPAVVAVGK